MEIEEPQIETLTSSVTPDEELQEKDLDYEQFSLEKTIEVENSCMKVPLNESPDVNCPTETNSENGKKKAKEEKPPTKIVVRRLPPTMTKDQFLDQVSPLPDIDHMHYVQGNVHDNVNPFSRAYLNFINQDDLFAFSNTFDNYVFLDSKGQEYPAVVEFNIVQRFPKQRVKKKDPLIGTIESDPAWITFKESILAEALENSKTQSGKATKQHYFETEISAAEEVNTTPLLEFLKVRRAEKARIREERREEKKRKELERKLKQKTKEKKYEGEEEEPSKDVKIRPKQSEKHEMETKEKFDNDSTQENGTVNKSLLNPDKKIVILKADEVSFDKSRDISSDVSQCKNHNSVDSKLVCTKCDRFLSLKGSSVKQGENKVKEAEQQTIFLRKLLGLLPSDSQISSTENEVSGKSNAKSKTNSTEVFSSICQRDVIPPVQSTSKTEPPEEVLSALKEYINVNQEKHVLWSKHNINPALPSASFKTSNSFRGQVGSGDASIQLRSLSAPRPADTTGPSGDALSRKATSSNPNVSLLQMDGDSVKVVHVSRHPRNNSDRVSESATEEVLTPKDRRDNKEKESRGNRRKEERDKIKEPRVREFKSRGGKSYQEERLKLAERREEKKRELMNSGDKRHEVEESNVLPECNDSPIETPKGSEEKPLKIEKKRYEGRKRHDHEGWKEEKKRMRNDRNNSKRDGSEKKDDSRKNSEKRISDVDLRKKGKGYYKNSELRSDKRKIRDTHEQGPKTSANLPETKKKEDEVSQQRSRSFDDLNLIPSSTDPKNNEDPKTEEPRKEKKRSSSLENQRLTQDHPPNITDKSLQKKDKSHSRDSRQSDGTFRYKKELFGKKSESKMSSKKKERSDDKAEDCVKDKVRNSETTVQESGVGDGDNKETSRNKEQPRSDRRIRNKDRPSIEIYRPGMGKFSKQRLEKEKALGSSTEVDSPSHSPSPTPKSKLIS